MENLKYTFTVSRPNEGRRPRALVGVVASGNLEVLLEHCLNSDQCSVEVATPVRGFAEVWKAVIADFVARWATGGLRISINDAGARPDTVALRLAQGVRLLERQ